MVKICRSCLNMFEGHISIDNCPMRECGGWELIEIDDMLADVIIRFWSMGISTAFCCSGHLYESCFSPHIMFDEPRDDEGRKALTFLREMIVDLNTDENQVEIGEIKPLRDMYVFTVSAKQCENHPIDRLLVQSDFLFFLYDSSEFIREVIFEDSGCACTETQ